MKNQFIEIHVKNILVFYLEKKEISSWFENKI